MKEWEKNAFVANWCTSNQTKLLVTWVGQSRSSNHRTVSLYSPHASTMSAHMHYIKNAVLKSSAVLKHNLEESNAAGEDEQDPITTDLRELIINFDHTPTMVRRVYLQTSDSSSLTSVGWVINEHIGFCMSCLKSFTLFNRRHHCRACGLLLCSECTPSSSLLQEFEDLGVQRVCGKCNPKVSMYIFYIASLSRILRSSGNSFAV